jgi:purine-nucleoside phosphorylase
MLKLKFVNQNSLQSPLVGHNDERFGPRFPAVNRIYTKSLRDLFKDLARNSNLNLKEGIYALFGKI